MNGRPEGVDPSVVRGFRVSSVSEIVDGEGRPVALQMAFKDGSSLISTVWTDWSLLTQLKSNTGIPSYFWPGEEHSLRPLLEGVSGEGLEVISVAVLVNDLGEPMGLDVVVGEHLVSARSVGGEISVSVH